MSKGVQGGKKTRLCLLVPSAPSDEDSSFADLSRDAAAVNDRLLAMLGSCIGRKGELAGDWRGAPAAHDALAEVRAFAARALADEPVGVVHDERLACLAPVWVDALGEAGVAAFMATSGDAARRLHEDASDDDAYRERLLTDYESQLATLREATHELREKLHKILDSRSWKLTRPLRHLGSRLRSEKVADITAEEDAFDASWYLAQYPDVAAAGMDAYEHYVTSGKKEGRLPHAPVAEPPRLPARPRWWQVFAGRSAAAGQGPVSASDDGAHADFDADFYLLQYPDIASAGVDPYQHYVSHGRAEGRHAVRPRLVIAPGGATIDANRDTVLVVAHEASRTGAPVLSLNLITALAQRYNVVAMLLGEGPLVEEFRASCSWLVGPMDLRGAPVRAAVIIEQLLALHQPKFAVVNSIECRMVLEPLARRGVATLSLVHEFATYTRPRIEFRNALHWADETVFSTPLTRESAYLEFPDLVEKAFTVIPQGRCKLPVAARDDVVRRREDARLLAALRPNGKADDSFVILGAGFVQHRKGVDLFIQCASQVLASERGRHCRFVWIGSGYDPERDMAYSVYLADQLRRAGLEQVVRIIPETASIETAYRSADVLLLSSRLDPLPNVAIDAMAHGLPVVCFDKTTGIADVLVEAGLRDALVAGYLDTHDMAAKLLDLANSSELRQAVRQRVQAVVERRFNMATYVGQLEGLALEAAGKLSRRTVEAVEIERSGLFDVGFHGSRQTDEASLAKVIEFDYLRTWACGVSRRKPFPGFHPGVYRELRGLSLADDPLADFIRAGRPAGPWLLEVITAGADDVPVASGARVALHVHVYYPDMLPDVLARIAGNRLRPELFISVPSQAAKATIEPLLAAYDGKVAQVQVVPNRGRDIGPFLTAFGADWSGYDIVGHLHTKKSLDLSDPAFGFRWNAFLMDNLIGRQQRMADAIVARMLADPTLGLVFPDDPNVVGWTGNLPFAKDIGARLGLLHFPAEFNFPVGTMFWARPAALAPLMGLGMQWDDYPAEPLGYDGTRLHAIERLVPFVAGASGFRCAVTHVPGVTR